MREPEASSLGYENQRDRDHHGTHNRGENNVSHKLTIEEVREIRASWSPKVVTKRTLAERYGVSYSTIVDVLRRRTWIDA